VAAELIAKGLTAEQTDDLFVQLKNATMSNELQKIVDITVGLGVPRDALKFNPNLVRGLDYYTDLIFEGRIPEYTVGSIGGGGRYNNLIKDLSGVEMPAVGFGIGFDRTVEAAEQLGTLNLSPTATKVLVTVFDETTLEASLTTTQQLRAAGIATELYPAIDKLGKQFKLADQKNIPFAVVIGQDEIDKNVVTLKNLQDGSQTQVSINQLITQLAG
jgi:histidyl-tRNA synthetase